MCLKAHQQSLQIFNYKAAQGVLQHLLRGCLNLQCPLSGVSSPFSALLSLSTPQGALQWQQHHEPHKAAVVSWEMSPKTMFCSQSLSAEWLLKKHWCTSCPDSTCCLHYNSYECTPVLMDWPLKHLCATGKNHCLNNTHCSMRRWSFLLVSFI